MKNPLIYARTSDLVALSPQELEDLLLEDANYNNKGVLRLLIKDLVANLQRTTRELESVKQESAETKDSLDAQRDLVLKALGVTAYRTQADDDDDSAMHYLD